MKTRTHKFVLTVTFDRPCTKTFALREMKDSGDINTTGYTSENHPEPETFHIRSIKSVSRS